MSGQCRKRTWKREINKRSEEISSGIVIEICMPMVAKAIEGNNASFRQIIISGL